MTGVVLLTGATGFVDRQAPQAQGECSAQIRAVIHEGTQCQLATMEAIETVVTTQDIFAEIAKYLQSVKNLDCLRGASYLAKVVFQRKTRRFIGIGASFKYDLTGSMLPLRPLKPYAGAKAAVFMALSHWLHQHGIEFAWRRLFYLHGEGGDTVLTELSTKFFMAVLKMEIA